MRLSEFPMRLHVILPLSFCDAATKQSSFGRVRAYGLSRRALRTRWEHAAGRDSIYSEWCRRSVERKALMFYLPLPPFSPFVSSTFDSRLLPNGTPWSQGLDAGFHFASAPAMLRQATRGEHSKHAGDRKMYGKQSRMLWKCFVFVETTAAAREARRGNVNCNGKTLGVWLIARLERTGMLSVPFAV